jgi:hypothetical protein
MANPEHLKILKQGVESWNQWRKEKPKVLPGLAYAKLNHTNLIGVDLSETKLTGASLIATDLSEANLSMADLSWADFKDGIIQDANLNCADLSDANLTNTNLMGANLTNANLMGANLMDANLNDANIEYALIRDTIFSNINLSKTKGLNKLQAFAHSIIDHQTLIRSNNLPEKFLRDCGLPDQLIEHLPGLLNSLEPIQFHSVFISYSSQDEEFANRLHADLQAKGIRCWFAPEDMKTGDKIRTRIDEAIQIHDKLLLVLSKDSVNSKWVEKEVETAFAKEGTPKETVLFPIRLDDTVMKIKTGWPGDIQRSRHIGDFKEWKDHDAYQKSFARLLKDLKQES